MTPPDKIPLLPRSPGMEYLSEVEIDLPSPRRVDEIKKAEEAFKRILREEQRPLYIKSGRRYTF